MHPSPPYSRTLRFVRRLAISAAVLQSPSLFTQAPIASIRPAAESLFHVTVDVSDSPELASSYTKPGQYLQLRLPQIHRLTFLAIASPPSLTHSKGIFEFLVKRIAGSTAAVLCELGGGDLVELSPAIGNGFQIHRIPPPQSLLIFATGSAISPIRSLIEMGFGANERSDVRLFYGARNLKRMAYQDRFKEWESSGVEVVPVLSQPDDDWKGERGYVQAAFSRARQVYNPQSTGAVLCGYKQMAQEITSVLVSEGVSSEKILKNF